jgi:ComF family protein
MALLELLLPPVCMACGLLLRRDRTPELCATCRAQVTATGEAAPAAGAISAAFLYEGPLALALQRCKYGGDAALAGPLGRALAAAPGWRCDRDGVAWTDVVAVPMHWRRRLRRGFDHARLLLRAACMQGGPRRRDSLRRVRHGTPQVELGASARAGNLDDAFAVSMRTTWLGRRVLVVDDVTTTGATLHAAMAALRAAGVEATAGLVLMRTA